MRILYFLSAVVLVVVLIVGCTGEPQGVVDPVKTTGMVPPPPGVCSAETPGCGGVNPCTDETDAAGQFYFPSCLGCDKFVQCEEGTHVVFVWPCPPGYTGTNCEINIDECASDPCVNGVCIDLVNGYSCECDPGWTGTNCDVPEVTDADGDGVPDASDNCAGTASGDVVDATGCSIAQYCPCIPNPLLTEEDWNNHGDYVSCVAQTAENFVTAGLITSAQKDAIVSAAGQSNCGKK